jgi:hypothetical protein
MTTKRALRALENVFAAEIDNRLPFQSKAAIYKQLRDEGLLQDMVITLGPGSSFAVTVRGYQLTHAGRLTYCLSCPDPEQQEESPVQIQEGGAAWA